MMTTQLRVEDDQELTVSQHHWHVGSAGQECCQCDATLSPNDSSVGRTCNGYLGRAPVRLPGAAGAAPAR